MMMILGIDPGTKESAICLYNGIHSLLSVPNVPNGRLIQEIQAMRSLHYPLTIACEVIQGMGLAVGKETFETCYVIGGIFQAFGRKNIIEVTRNEVKVELCGRCKGVKDANVLQALKDRVGPKGTKKEPGPTFGVTSHGWSALAVAVTAEARIKGEL